MKMLLSISTMLLLFGPRGYGQAVPTATTSSTPTPAASAGPKLSWLDGSVHYALSATELVQVGYYGSGTTSTTALSGNVAYMSLSQVHPFSLLVASGVLFGQGGQGTTTFQNVAVTQGLIKGKWVLGVNDSFSFMPQSPTTGLSGVAGVGPIGTTPIQGPSSGPAGGVLTYSSNRISNTMGGNVERLLTGKTSVSGMASWNILHFLNDNSGLDTSAVTGQVAVNHRINLRNSLSLSAVYSTYETNGLLSNLPGLPYNNVTYQTKGLNLTYMRQWTRSLSTNVSVGPQWVSSSSAALVPDRLNVYVDAGANYTRQMGNVSLHYNHGVNNGSGAFAGAEADTFTASASRNITHDWAASAWGSYTRTTGLLYTLPNSGIAAGGAVNTEYGTLQLTHGFSRTISGYVSYSAQNQDSNTPLVTQNIYNGLSHTFGIGVSWTPQSTRLGDF
jgi:hypothetical protein